MKISQDRINSQDRHSVRDTALLHSRTGPLYASRRARSGGVDASAMGLMADGTSTETNYSKDYETRVDSAPYVKNEQLHEQLHGEGQYRDAATYEETYQSPRGYYRDKSADELYDKASSKRSWPHNNTRRVVVVFLLLLMALVVLGLMYRLFSNPGQTQNEIVGATNAAKTKKATEALESLPTSTAKIETAETKITQSTDELSIAKAQTGAPDKISRPESQTFGKNNYPSYADSPMSSVTPGGENVARVPPIPTTPPADNHNGTLDKNDSLAMSKIGGIGYWIQVGAFSNLSNANKMKRQLAQNDLQPVIQEGRNGTKKVYRVRVGLYTSKEETKRILRQLKNIDRTFENSIIVQTEI